MSRDDLAVIGSIIDEWHGDASETLVSIENAISGETSWKYVVAEALNGQVLGIMGLATSGVNTDLIDSSARTAELVSAYVTRAARGTGAGRALADELEKMATKLGYARLLIVSGSRNREYGYPFWRRRYGEPFRTDEDYFAPGAERVVWAKKLSK